MSSKAGSTFVTFLMSIPVAAAGLMAIFGVPPLSSVIAASRNLNEKIQELGAESRSSTSDDSSEFEEWDEETAPDWGGDQTTPADALDERTKSKSKDSKRLADRDDLGFSRSDSDGDHDTHEVSDLTSESHQDPPRRSLFDKPSHDHRDAHAHSHQEQDGVSPPSMKESLKKLHLVSGMKHYHLEPGAEADTWLFVCLFSASDDSQAVYRFESEASEPESAVKQTLDQIEAWQLERFRGQQAISQFSNSAGTKPDRTGSRSTTPMNEF